MRLSLISILFLLGSGLLASAKKGKDNRHRIRPVYRSLHDVDDNVEAPTTTGAAESFSIGQSRASDEGRFFKHFLLLKSLTESNKSPEPNYVPYFIVNSPATLTNVNSNIISNNNNPTTAATTTMGTGTGTAAGTGAGAAAGGGTAVRVQYGNNRQALPYAVPGLPTPIYHQRTQPLPQIIYGPPMKRVVRKKSNNNRRTNPFSNLANNWKRIQFL